MFSKKINAKDYFMISSFLKDKKEDDFRKYRNDINKNDDKKFGSDPINKVELYIEKCSDKTSEKKNPYQRLKFLSRWLYSIAALVGVLLTLVTIMMSTSSVNINIFLLFAIFIPFIFTVYMFYKLIFYKFPEEEERSWLFSRIQKYYDSTHNHVLSMYFIKSLNSAVIIYAASVIMTLFIITAMTSVKYHFSSTYNIEKIEPKIVSVVSSPWKVFFPDAVPSLDLIKSSNNKSIKKTDKDKNLPHSPWVLFVMMAILFWTIIPRLALNVIAAFKLDKTIRISIKKQAKPFLDFISDRTSNSDDINITKVEIPSKTKNLKMQNSQQNKQKSSDNKSIKKLFEKEVAVLDRTIVVSVEDSKHENVQNELLSESKTSKVHKISYQRDTVVIGKVDSQLSNVQDGDKKALKLKGMKKKDNQEVIDALCGQVFIYTSTSSNAPDETFVDIVKDIWHNKNVEEMLIIPFVEDDNYRLVKTGDRKYEDFKKKIKNLEDKENIKVRIKNV